MRQIAERGGGERERQGERARESERERKQRKETRQAAISVRIASHVLRLSQSTRQEVLKNKEKITEFDSQNDSRKNSRP